MRASDVRNVAGVSQEWMRTGNSFWSKGAGENKKRGKKMKRKLIAVSMATLMACGTLSGCGLVEFQPDEDATKTYLYIDTPPGGFGAAYLEKAAQAFMDANPKASYADGKEGVVIEVDVSSSNTAKDFPSYVKNPSAEIHVVEGLYYTQLLNAPGSSNVIIDLTDVVKAELADGKTIEDKLNTEQKQVLQSEGKYFTIPTFAGYTGVTYNADLFEEYGFYFVNDDQSPEGERSTYTNKAYTGRKMFKDLEDEELEDALKSPGPDGVMESDDDGLPSSYEEFFYLCDAMLANSPKVTPLIYYNGHYSNYLFQELLCAASTANGLKSTFSFDSNNEEIEIVTDWNQDGTPKTEKVAITEDNGYDSTRQYAKYQALKFIEHMSTYNNGQYVHSGSRGKSLSNTEVQRDFMRSYLSGSTTDIGMMLEGVYWYNEAAGERSDIDGSFGAGASNMNLKYMPLPAQETGTVKEGEGTTQLVVDCLQYYLVANAKLANDPEKLALAKDFLKFMYTDSMLQEMTITSGIPFALKYDLTDAQYKSMHTLSKSFWDTYKKAKDADSYITGIGASLTFQSNPSRFSFKSDNYGFASGATKELFAYFYEKMKAGQNYSLKDIFNGMTISSSDWATKYKK